MPKTCKIETLGLSETVQQLMAEGVTTRAEMTEKLQQEYGAEVSEATVGRFMARVRKAAENEAFNYIQDHVNRTVPADMEALEEMEAQSLLWTRKAGKSQAERSAAAVEQIAGELEKWHQRFFSLTEEERPKFIKWVVKQCLFYLAEDDRRQEKRLEAMRMVHKIIETKLSKAGLLDDDQKGRIVFLQRQVKGEDDAPDGTGHSDSSDKKVIRLTSGADNG